MPPPRHLFVYGTLRPECVAAGAKHLTASLLSLGTGRVAGALYDLGPYPGAVPGSGVIRGHIYSLDGANASVLNRIDLYEGYRERDPASSLFVRTGVQVRLDNEEILECWIYWYNREIASGVRIPDGDYVRWLPCRGGS